VAVETQGTWTAGTTVVDIEGRLGQPANAQVGSAFYCAGGSINLARSYSRYSQGEKQ
jgi:inosine-uridine nucleoside N-ribohydrolase